MRFGSKPDDILDTPIHYECRECHRELWTRGDEEQPDGPFICDTCIRDRVSRAAANDFTRNLFNTAVMMARVQR